MIWPKKKLDIGNFRALNESADRWNAQNNVKFKTASCEEKSCTTEMTGPSKKNLTTILSSYKLEDIFNADEFGFFFQALPNKTPELKGEKCSGEKFQTHRKVKKYLYLSLERAKIRDASKTQVFAVSA